MTLTIIGHHKCIGVSNNAQTWKKSKALPTHISVMNRQ